MRLAGEAGCDAPGPHEAIVEGAAQRVRPVMMTVSASSEACSRSCGRPARGADVMKRIARAHDRRPWSPHRAHC